jgi:protein TonB
VKGARALLVAAAASVALHGAVAGALWALSLTTPRAPAAPAAKVPARQGEPVRVALFEGAPGGAAAAGPPAPAPAAAPVPAPVPVVRAPARPRPVAAFPADPSRPEDEAPALGVPAAGVTAPPGLPGAGASAGAGPTTGGPSHRPGGSGEPGGAGSGEGPGEGASGPDLRGLSEALRRAAVRCYPAPARRFRLTGSARVSFCVGEGGGHEGLKLLQTSGHPLLDQAAVGCVVPGAVPLPADPGCFELAIDFTPAR